MDDDAASTKASPHDHLRVVGYQSLPERRHQAGVGAKELLVLEFTEAGKKAFPGGPKSALFRMYKKWRNTKQVDKDYGTCMGKPQEKVYIYKNTNTHCNPDCIFCDPNDEWRVWAWYDDESMADFGYARSKKPSQRWLNRAGEFDAWVKNSTTFTLECEPWFEHGKHIMFGKSLNQLLRWGVRDLPGREPLIKCWDERLMEVYTHMPQWPPVEVYTHIRGTFTNYGKWYDYEYVVFRRGFWNFQKRIKDSNNIHHPFRSPLHDEDDTRMLRQFLPKMLDGNPDIKVDANAWLTAKLRAEERESDKRRASMVHDLVNAAIRNVKVPFAGFNQMPDVNAYADQAAELLTKAVKAYKRCRGDATDGEIDQFLRVVKQRVEFEFE